jgi:hypothetical protein
MNAAVCDDTRSGNAKNAQSSSAMNAGVAAGKQLDTLPFNSERSIMNKRRTGLVSLIVSAVIFVSGLWVSGSVVTAGGGNRCTDHCADIYKVKKDACKLIPFKTERKICERRAKEAKEDCKHRCR